MGWLSSFFKGVDDLAHNAGRFVDNVAHLDFKGIDDEVRNQRDTIMENPALKTIAMPVVDYFTAGLGSTALNGWYNKSKTGSWGVGLGDIAKGYATNYGLTSAFGAAGLNSVAPNSWGDVAQNTALGAAKGGTKSVIGGGSFGDGALQGGINSGVTGSANYATTDPNLAVGAVDQQTEVRQQPNFGDIQQPVTGGTTKMGDNDNPFLSYFGSMLGTNNQGQSTFAGNTGGQLASSLLGMYSGYQQKKAAQGMQQQLSSIYSPDSAYAQQMDQALTRKDAAAGRRSQYGPRQAQLAAMLSQGRASTMNQQGQFSNQAQSGNNMMLKSLLQLGGGRGGPLDQLGGGLRSMYNSYNQPSYDSSPMMGRFNNSDGFNYDPMMGG